MARAIHEIAGQAHWKLSTILRTRRFHSTKEIILLYKAQVLSYIEASTAAVAHAPAFFLSQLDFVQQRLLQDLNLSPEVALLDYRLAPLKYRRDMALLGLIHRICTKQAPPQFLEFIRPRPIDAVDGPRQWRLDSCAHSRQMLDLIDGRHSRAMERCAWPGLHLQCFAATGR